MSKKDGSLWMCIDYRKLDKVTIKNSYPLPRIDDLFDQLRGAIIFSSTDFRSSYHQVAVKEEHIKRTTFCTRYEHFEFPVMLFGVMNAPTTFIDMINRVFNRYLDKFIMVFIEDVLVYSPTYEDHARHLTIVLQTFHDHHLYAKLEKCKFWRDSM